MQTITAHSCPDCGARVIGEYRGSFATLVNTKGTNVIICEKRCGWFFDMDSWKKAVLTQ